jgi:hypothetical protein
MQYLKNISRWIILPSLHIFTGKRYCFLGTKFHEANFSVTKNIFTFTNLPLATICFSFVDSNFMRFGGDRY